MAALAVEHHVESLIKIIDCRRDVGWLTKALSAIRYQGIAIIAGVLDQESIDRSLKAVEHATRAIEEDLGIEKLREARQNGYNELRLPMKYEPYFFEFLAVPQLLEVVDATLSPTAVLRFQNVEVLPRHDSGEVPLNQCTFHMNSPRVIPGYLASLEVEFALTSFRPENDVLRFVLGTHQQQEPPDRDFLEWAAVPLNCPAGTLVVFDSTLWHREGQNRSDQDVVFVLHQFTRSFVKPHFDYARALGEPCMMSLPERTRQLLGWHTRLPTSLQEFYLPHQQRLYRTGQG